MIAVPTRRESFTVFAQSAEPSLDADGLKSHAARFFKAIVTFEAVTDEAPAGVVATKIAVDGEAREVFGQAATQDDRDAADAAEARVGYTGLALLASRCRVVWQVRASSDTDAVALRIAAILAAVSLGPILTPSGESLIGVKTARATLERLSAN